MKTITVIAFIATLLLASVSSTFAKSSETERMTVLMGLDQDGQGSQDIHIPIPWSETWSSGLDYKGRSYGEKVDLPEVDGKEGVFIDESRFDFNLLTWKNEFCKLGMNITYVSMKKSEIGHTYIPLDGETETTLKAFENDVDIELIRPSFAGELSRLFFNRHLYLRSSFHVSPISQLQVDHETNIVPTLDQTLIGHSKESQKPFVSFEGEAQVVLRHYLRLGASVSYEYFPIEYTMDLSPYGGTINMETVDTSLSWNIRLIFNTPSLFQLNPTIGYGQEHIQSDDKNDDSNDNSTTIKKFIVGFERSF